MQLFEKISKGLFKKYQASKAFKELVKPPNSMFDKGQSFRLKREDGLKNSEKNKGSCC